MCLESQREKKIHNRKILRRERKEGRRKNKCIVDSHCLWRPDNLKDLLVHTFLSDKCGKLIILCFFFPFFHFFCICCIKRFLLLFAKYSSRGINNYVNFLFAISCAVCMCVVKLAIRDSIYFNAIHITHLFLSNC